MIGISLKKTIASEWKDCAFDDGLTKESKDTYDNFTKEAFLLPPSVLIMGKETLPSLIGITRLKQKLLNELTKGYSGNIPLEQQPRVIEENVIPVVTEAVEKLASTELSRWFAKNAPIEKTSAANEAVFLAAKRLRDFYANAQSPFSMEKAASLKSLFSPAVKKSVESSPIKFHAAELTGLGLLSVPSIKALVTNDEMDPQRAHAIEVVGLGTLAAPSIMSLVKSMSKKASANLTPEKNLLYTGVKKVAGFLGFNPLEKKASELLGLGTLAVPSTLALKSLMFKKAGGPGSGVEGDNTEKIDMPITPYITIMKRTAFMNSRKPFAKDKTVSMSKIKFVGQEKYVPKKLQKFIDAVYAGETWPFEKPVDLTIDSDGNYHVLDGHHRYLAAKHFGKKSIKANVYTLKRKDVQEISLEKVAFNLAQIGSAFSRAPGVIKDMYQRGKHNIQSGQWKETAKDLGKGTYNLALGGKTVQGKWDPLYGAKSMGRAREQYTSGPLQGLYKYDGANHALDLNKPRNFLGFAKDEFSGASRTRGDLAAKQMARKQKMEVGDFLNSASDVQKNQIRDINQMKAMDFMRRYPKLAANYYGRNVVQKGLTVGLPGTAVYDVASGANQAADPRSSGLANNLGTLAGGAGWALTGPLGLAGSLGAVSGLTAGAKGLGNLVSTPRPTSGVNLPIGNY